MTSIRELIQDYLKDGEINHQSNRPEPDRYCPVCRGSGWELFDKDGYETARRCPKCQGATQYVVQERRENSGLPCRYKSGVTLDDFDPRIYEKVSGEKIDLSKKMWTLRNFIYNYYEWEQKGFGLYIYSSTKGSGKSYLASCISNSLMQKYAIPVKFISASELIDRSKEERGIRDLQDVKVLVLDDIGVKSVSLNWMDDILFQLIDKRNSNGKVTIYTSNLKLGELPIDERVKDRINEKAITVNLPEICVRMGLSAGDKQEFINKLNRGT